MLTNFPYSFVGPTCCFNRKGSDKLRIKRMLAKVLLFAYVLSTLFMYCNIVSDSIATDMLRGSVTARLVGYVLLMPVKEFGRLFIGISSLLEKIS